MPGPSYKQNERLISGQGRERERERERERRKKIRDKKGDIKFTGKITWLLSDPG